MTLLEKCEARRNAFYEDPSNPANWPKGPTYGEVVPAPSQEEINRRIAIVNQERMKGKK